MASLVSAAHPLSFDQEHNATLDGQWLFYPQQLLNASPQVTQRPYVVQLPSSFSEITGDKNNFGTFQQHFLLPREAVGHNIYLYVPYQYGAYKLYIDGHVLIKVGHVGDKTHHQTEMAPKLASFLAHRQNVTITIEVSSFNHINSGLQNPILIGYNRPILDKFYSQIIPLSVVSGILLMTGLFMIFFALFRSLKARKGHVVLFLGLFILCLSLRSFFSVPFIYTLFTEISWLWGTRLEYLLTELACIFFLAYVYLLPYRLVHTYLFKLTCIIICLNIGVTLLTEPLIFQKFFFQSFSIAFLIFLNLIYSAYLMNRRKMKYSKVNSVAVMIVCLTFIHDYLLALKIINSTEIAFYTSCLYFLLITFQLSRDYAVQSIHTEILNRKLMRLNKNLDRKVQERTHDITLLNEKLARQVRSDSLTGAYNRFALNEEIQIQYDSAIKQRSSLVIYMIDVDYFKNYNDYYGHLKGDIVLKSLVQSVTKILPKEAFLARYGGEEFVILLPNMNYDQAASFADLLCQVIRQLKIEHLNRRDEKMWVTVSVGAAVMDHQHIYSNIHLLMKVADQQLYIAKQQRDSISIS